MMVPDNISSSPKIGSVLPSFKKRSLPEILLIGYATECNQKVVQAVRDGLNVIIWSFCELHYVDDGDNVDNNSNKDQECAATTSTTTVRLETNSLDLDCIQKLMIQLDEEGFDNVVHLVSFGGWNGPHLDPKLDAQEWYDAFQRNLGHIFHGLDWDLEGHDNKNSPTNEFSWACLDKMGKISQLMKANGYIVGMAPPQSYLDVSSSYFSRQVTLSRRQRKEYPNSKSSSSSSSNNDDDFWHPEFTYFGANVYAYLLAKYGTDIFDFISIQFYESYSRAGKSIYHEGMSPEDYLISYVTDLVVKNNESYYVNFGGDDNNDTTKEEEGRFFDGSSSKLVSLPISKLVWGFANAWAMDTDKDKVIYFPPKSVEGAYQYLLSKKMAPRGCMMWVIGEEGKHGIHYIPAISSILFGKKDDARDTK